MEGIRRKLKHHKNISELIVVRFAINNICWGMVLVILNYQSYGQAKYSFSSIDTDVSKYTTRQQSNEVISKFVHLIDSLNIIDQKKRTLVPYLAAHKQQKYLSEIDSEIYSALDGFFHQNGIPPLNKKNVPNDSLRMAIEFSRFTLFSHLSEKYSKELFRHYMNSVKKGISDINSLKTYTIQYLLRATQFPTKSRYRVVCIPNIYDTTFGKFFIQATIDFLNNYYHNTPNNRKVYFFCRNPRINAKSQENVYKTLEINQMFKRQGLKFYNNVENICTFILQGGLKNYDCEICLIVYTMPKEFIFFKIE